MGGTDLQVLLSCPKKTPLTIPLIVLSASRFLTTYYVYINNVVTNLPSEVILMRDISAGVPINEPTAPAVIPELKQ